MIKRFLHVGFAVSVLAMIASDVTAHSGGTNSAGCHTNRKTGDYHCHTPRTPELGSVTYCHVVNNENRCGYALNTCNNLVDQFGGYCVQE